MKNKKMIIGAVLATLCWGSAFPTIKLGYQLFHIKGDDIASKLLFAGYRFFIAGCIVLTIYMLSQRRGPKVGKEMVPRLIGLGLMQTTIQYIFFYIGMANTTGAKGAITNSFTAFFPILLAPFFFTKDRVTKEKLFGCALGLGGIIMVNYQGGDLLAFSPMGEGFILIAALAQSFATIYSKKLVQFQHVMLVAGYQLAFGGLLLVVIGILGHGNLDYKLNGCLLLIYMAFASAIAFSIWNALLKKNPVSQVSIFNLLIPVFGTLLSGIILGEKIWNLKHALSVCLVCLGIVVVNGNFNGDDAEMSDADK